MTTREDVVAEARRWIGTPFKAQHSARGLACDCAGLVLGVARELALLPDGFTLGAYSQQPFEGSTNAAIAAVCKQRRLADLAPGDVAEMDLGMRESHHVGIVGELRGRLTLIHALTGRKVVEHRIDAAWNRRIVGAWQLPGII